MTFDVNLRGMNNFVLRKQRLLGAQSNKDVAQIVKDIGGLHATSPTTPYLSLFARVNGFCREDLDEELYVKRRLGKIRYVRTTVYIVPKDMVLIAFAATRRMAEPLSEAYSKFLGVNERQYEETSGKIMEILKKGNGMTTRQIKKALGTTVNVSPIVNLMCDQGLLIRGAPEKGWISNIHTYYLLSEYFPDLKLNQVGEAAARKAVVRQYLASFGPVTEDDVFWWTGFPRRQTKEIIEDLGEKITYVDISDMEKTHLMLLTDKTLLMSGKTAEKHVVNVLPGLDPYLMGFKDRERYLNQRHYNHIFDRSGNSTSTILVDGRVIGVWDFEEPFVKMFLFDDVEAEVMNEIRFKARSVGGFLSGKDVEIKECDSMVPLTQRTAGGVMSPLRFC